MGEKQSLGHWEQDSWEWDNAAIYSLMVCPCKAITGMYMRWSFWVQTQCTTKYQILWINVILSVKKIKRAKKTR